MGFGTLADRANTERANAGGYVRSLAVPRDGATQLALTMTLHGGRADVSGGATDLVTASSTRQDIGLRSVDRASDTTSVDLWMLEGPYMFGPESAWTVQLPSDLPVAFAFEGASGPFAVDLRDVRITSAQLRVGAADLWLHLPSPRGDVPVRIDGSTLITPSVDLPGGIEYRIAGGTVNVSRETPGYAGATDRYTITLGPSVRVTIR